MLSGTIKQACSRTLNELKGPSKRGREFIAGRVAIVETRADKGVNKSFRANFVQNTPNPSNTTERYTPCRSTVISAKFQSSFGKIRLCFDNKFWLQLTLFVGEF